MNWGVEYGRRNGVRKGKEGDKNQPNWVVVVSIDADYEDIGNSEGASIGHVFENGCDFDAALFPSWLQGITSKSVEKSENSLVNPGGYFPIWDIVDGEILDMERG